MNTIAITLVICVHAVAWLLLSQRPKRSDGAPDIHITTVKLLPWIDPRASHPPPRLSVSPPRAVAPTLIRLQPHSKGKVNPSPIASTRTAPEAATAEDMPSGSETQSPATLDLDHHPDRARLFTPAVMVRENADEERPRSGAGTLERQIFESARRDCKDAYANLGLLAAPRLIWDAAKDDGCKW